jgi:2'-5' RNA ligase
MNRRRLLVVVPVPGPTADKIDGIRQALGDPSLGNIGPHITLVPPVNVRDDQLLEACVLLRSLASQPTLSSQIGPITSFAPASPVLYLEVTELAAIRSIRDRIFQPPLSRPLSNEFIPHITVMRRATDDQIEHIPRLTDFTELVELVNVEILEESIDANGRHWSLLDDVALGSEFISGRGGLETVLTSSRRAGPDELARQGVDASADVVITASRHGQIVGVVTARSSHASLDVSSLVVDEGHRGSGVGRSLVSRLLDVDASYGLNVTQGQGLPDVLVELLARLGVPVAHR